MNKSTTAVIAILAVIGFSGATAAVVHHNDITSANAAMMRDEAMKKDEAAKAMKKEEEAAAMKKDEAAKAAAAPATGDAMAHDSTNTTAH
jgi:hypothetical protein